MCQVCFKTIVIALCITLVSITSNYAYAGNVVYLQPGKTLSLTATDVHAAAYQWFKNGKPIQGALQRIFKITGPGDYTVIAYNQESCPSELSDPITVKLTDSVNAKPDLWITAQSYARAYGENNPPQIFTYTGFIDGDDPSALSKLPAANTSATSTSTVGSYPIIPAGAQSNKYNIHYNNGTLTVNKAALLITAGNDIKTADGVGYTPKRNISGSGFVNGDQIASLNGELVFSGDAIGAVKPGRYTIMPAGLTSDNYQITYAPGTLTILSNSVDLAVYLYTDKKAATIGDRLMYTINITNKELTDATDVMVKSTLPAALEFVKTINSTDGAAQYDPSSRTLSWPIKYLKASDKTELTFEVKANGSGTLPVYATVKSLENDVNPSDNTAQALCSVNSFTIPNIFTPNGDGINDYFVIPALANYPDNEINIFNRSGNNVFTSKSYKNDWTGSGLSDGTYFYILKVNTGSDKSETYKGYVTLLRSNIKQINL